MPPNNDPAHILAHSRTLPLAGDSTARPGLGGIPHPLYADPPQPPEQLAADILLAFQVIASAMLFPVLLSTATRTLLIIAVSWPLLFLAGFLAVTPRPAILAAGVYLTAWLLALALWRRGLVSPRASLTAVAVATTSALGGPFLWYLGAELSPRSPSLDWPLHATFGPLMGAISQLHHSPLSLSAWYLPAALVLGGLLFPLLPFTYGLRGVSRRDTFSPPPPPDSRR